MSAERDSLFPCRGCGRWFRLRKDGRIPWHRANNQSRKKFAGKCDGSSLRPKWRFALIGLRATIAGYSTEGHAGTDSVAHICLDIEDGPRVFIQADDPAVKLRIIEEPR